jgi:hypothetical protein
MTGHAPEMQTGPEARAWLAAYADRLLAAVQPYASPTGSLITLPGRPGGYGTAVDGLEGFARTFLLPGSPRARTRPTPSAGPGPRSTDRPRWRQPRSR